LESSKYKKNIVEFHPVNAGLYQATVNGEKVPLLLDHHQVLKTLELLDPFKDWEKEDNSYFKMLVTGACRIAMYDK